MKSFKKFIKEHILLSLFIFFCVILLILLLLFYKFFIADITGDKYGDRLTGIEKVPVSDSTVSKLKSEMTSVDGISSTSYHLEGKIINVILDVEETLDKVKAKEEAVKVLTYFDEDELSFYDIQVLVKCSKCTTKIADDGTTIKNYPIIGYKKSTHKELVWSNN